MTRRADASASSAPRPRSPQAARAHYFSAIFELLEAAQSEIEEAIRLTRVDVGSRIGQLLSEARRRDGWGDEELGELSTWLFQRGADLDLCAAANLARMRRLYDLEQRVVRSDRTAVLDPSHSLVAPDDLCQELLEMSDAEPWDSEGHRRVRVLSIALAEEEEEDDDDDASASAANADPPATAKRN